ncbi:MULTISPECIES: glucokinase [Sphingomonas]|uniref:Glucokinase n=1 Tax=Sphingomonas kyungheensis TaxID=1069987 RepID=A0ABU8H5C7_9SPHN|nr:MULTISPECIES: glucokinase [unclassified Sphingomonas]EZP56116.1 Glucokinase [Sphingomonas sp. RIT328]
MEATGIVGHVGRKGLRFALTDAAAGFQADSLRHYGADRGASVSGALSAFQQDLALSRLPERLAIAVAGLARGDAISITQTRWFVSRSGLQAMLGQPPLILNDFEAEAWALSGGHAMLTPAAGSLPMLDRPGTYCVLGMTTGLGAAVLVRKPDGAVHVLATEAGHGGFAPGSPAMAALTARLFPDRHPVLAEPLISASGLVAIYTGLAAMQALPPRLTTPEEITRAASSDPLARHACEMLCEAFWTQASSLVLTYGSWDGVIVTGKLAAALRQMLAAPRMQTVFAGTGKYARLLATVPRAIATLDQGPLTGAAQALQRQG